MDVSYPGHWAFSTSSYFLRCAGRSHAGVAFAGRLSREQRQLEGYPGTEIEATGSRRRTIESGIVATLDPGAYTMIVRAEPADWAGGRL